jgi:hypothetical protein
VCRLIWKFRSGLVRSPQRNPAFSGALAADVCDGWGPHVKADCTGEHGKYFFGAAIADGELMQLEIILEPIGAKSGWTMKLSR